MKAGNEFVPLAIPDLGATEEQYVLDAIRSTWISSSGKYVKQFEQALAEICAVRHAISVNNGTCALHLAVVALGLQPGDEVIVPSLTYIATANAVRYAHGVPVFVDVEPGTWCLDPNLIQAALSPRTKGIIAVDLYGHPCDMDRIRDIAAAAKLWVIEDAAEAHFARYKGRPTGSLGDVSTFSFFGNKIVTSGEGGAVTTDNPDLDRHMRLLRNQGMDPHRRYFFPEVGFNYRMTNLACALLCAQLERREHLTRRRLEIFARYRSQLQSIPGLDLQPVAPWAQITPWLFCVTVDAASFGHSRDEVMALLEQKGIETRPFFIPIHQLPPYVEKGRTKSLPQTERLSASGINLPTFTGMSDTQIDRVCATLIAARG